MISLIWKRPKNVTIEEQLRFDVASMGLFLHQNKLVVVTDDVSLSLEGRSFQGIHSPVDALLRLLRHTVYHYLGHLKAIKQITVELGDKLSSSMENRYFLQMFALGESLDLLHQCDRRERRCARKAACERRRLGFSVGQLESLADLMLDNQQCSRQAQIYSSVLSGFDGRPRHDHQQQRQSAAEEPDVDHGDLPAVESHCQHRRHVRIHDDDRRHRLAAVVLDTGRWNGRGRLGEFPRVGAVLRS